MKAKITRSIFFQKDFAIKIVNEIPSKYFLFAMSLIFSFGAVAQPYPLHNGRTIIKHHHSKTPGSVVAANIEGFNPFSIIVNSTVNNKSSRTQMIYTSDEFTDSGASSGVITQISFNVARMNGDEKFVCNDFTIRLGLTNLADFKNSTDQYVPGSDPLTTVRSGPITIKPGQGYVPDLNVNLNGGWITIVLDTPFAYDLSTGSNLIVDVSKTLGSGSAWVANNHRIFVASYANPASPFYGVRGCYATGSTNIPDGKDMFTSAGGNSTNTIPNQSQPDTRGKRPYIKFTYLASATNSQSFQYSGVPLTPICYGDPITIQVENMYATGYSGFEWKASNAPESGYVAISEETVNATSLSTTQPAEKTYFRLEAYLPNGSSSFNGDSYAKVSAIKTFEAGAWVDGEIPAAGESAYFKENPNWDAQQIMDLCSIKVANGVDFTVPTGKTLILDRPIGEDDIAGSGKLIFENNSSLLQTTAEQNVSTKVEYKRTTPVLNRYDFTYYSSPVSNTTLFDVSPLTLWDKYYSYDNNLVDKWKVELGTTVMEAGKGYLIRAPQTYAISGNPQPFNATFKGSANNGSYPIAVSSTIGDYNLIGNPYPSAVDAVKFVQANTKLEGTIYLWRHINAPTLIEGTHYYGYNNTDYLTVNRLGSTDGPTEYMVAAGQSFMIKTLSESGTLEGWKNEMRVGTTAIPTAFYKMQNTDPAKEIKEAKPTAGRFWLEIKANSGALQRILVGYIDGATENYDRMYDAEQINSGNIGFYTIANNQQQLAIMAKGLPFNREDVIPLGFSTSVAGNHTISKFLEDGFMPKYAVYLNDKLTNTVHNLSESAYTFATASGTFNDRFVIAYKLKTVSNLADFVATPNKVVIFDKAESVQLHSGKELMDTVVVYDLSGRILTRALNCNSAEVALANLPRKNQLLVVEIHLENGTVETQKFRF